MFYIPQVIAMHRARELRGFSLPAWVSLLVAVICLTLVGLLADLKLLMAANVVSTVAVTYAIVQIVRKG